MVPFSNIPFFRILIPFAAGIGIGIGVGTGQLHWWFAAALTGIAGLLNFYADGKKHSVITLVCMDVFLGLYGWTLVNLATDKTQAHFYGNNIKSEQAATILGVVNDLPVKKEKFVKCSMRVLEVKQDIGYEQARGKMIAYFRRSSSDSVLRAGKVLLFRAKLIEAPAPKNPYEFDYKAYLNNRQVYHTAFVDSGAYVPVAAGEQLNALWQLGLDCKQYVLQELKNSRLSGTAYAICAALLTGYDDEIERPVMESFSHSGTLHVLSVSGLHTGLIYLALGFLFDLADRKRKHKLLKFALISLVLWFFALITGFSAPVLRAVIMFSLLGLGKIYFRNDYRNQVNILCVSAFLLLSYDPFYLVDIGFLLSYLALFGLIYFQPRLSRHWQPRNMLVNSLWQSITASVAATISTLPITLFCFKQFPLWFFVCNVVVVPATFVLLLLALLVVARLSLAALVINYLVSGLVWFIGLFNSERYGFIDRIDFSMTDALYLSLVILLVSSALQTRSYRQLSAALLVLICWQLSAMLVSYKAKDQILFSVYQSGKAGIFSVKNKTEAMVTPADPANYNYHVKPHITSFNNAQLVFRSFNYVNYGPEEVLILQRHGFWPVADVSTVTTLVLGNNFRLSSVDMKRFPKLKNIVADGSNNSYTIQKTEELSRKFGLSFYDAKSRGAYVLPLD